MAGVDCLVRRLETTHDAIEDIRALTGNPGLSIGVVHQGEIIHRANFGYQDVEAKIPPNSDTIFHVGSLTKGIIAAEYALLVQEGKINWDTLVSDHFPEFRKTNPRLRDPRLATDVTLRDFLSHQLSDLRANGLSYHKNNTGSFDPADTATMISCFEPRPETFRKGMYYNNYTYPALGRLLEPLTGKSAGAFAEERIFHPLGMKRTTMARVPLDTDNYTKTYTALANATPLKIPPPIMTDKEMYGGAGGTKSSLNDLLAMYQAMMRAYSDREGTCQESKIFPRVTDIWHGIAPMGDQQYGKYALGWVSANLPAPGGLVSVNLYDKIMRPDELPRLGRAAPRHHEAQMLYHNGAVVGGLSAVYLFPATQTAVVVLGNGLDICDTSDCVAQMLVETLISDPADSSGSIDALSPADFVDLTREAVKRSLQLLPDISKQLADERLPCTTHRPLDEYAGRYSNVHGPYIVEVTVNGRGLRLKAQDIDRNVYELQHYHHDVFYWETDHDGAAKEILFTPGCSTIDPHRVYFTAQDGGKIDTVKWAMGGFNMARDIFKKVTS